MILLLSNRIELTTAAIGHGPSEEPLSRWKSMRMNNANCGATTARRGLSLMPQCWVTVAQHSGTSASDSHASISTLLVGPGCARNSESLTVLAMMQRHTGCCKECGGGSICQHGRIRSQCKECGGGSICQHGRIRSRCKDCKGMCPDIECGTRSTHTLFVSGETPPGCEPLTCDEELYPVESANAD